MDIKVISPTVQVGSLKPIDKLVCIMEIQEKFMFYLLNVFILKRI